MCRNSASGGRRCPSHSNQAKIEARNTKRREDYRAAKNTQTRITELASSGLVAVAGKNFETNYFHSSRGVFNPELFVPAKNQDYSWMDSLEPEVREMMLETPPMGKPTTGGLWSAPATTSTENGIRTGWTEWAGDNDFTQIADEMIEIKADKHALIITCSTVEEIQALCDKYPGYPVDWEKMTEDGISGVHFTQEGINAAKGNFTGKVGAFGVWDIPSTLWLSPDAFTSGKTVKVDASHRDDSNDEDDHYSPWDDTE